MTRSFQQIKIQEPAQLPYAAVMKKPKRPRKHSVKAELQIMELSKSGTSITLEIFADEEKLGTLVIGRGSVTWYGNRWRNGRRFSWPAFASKMET